MVRMFGREYRGSVVTAVAVGGVAIVGLAVLAIAMAGGGDEQVATSSSVVPTARPSSDPSPTPSVTPSLDPEGRALPGFVTTRQDLPTALPLPDGLLEASSPGWMLGLYRPEVLPTWPEPPVDADLLAEPEYQVVYLANTRGDRYQLLELPPEPSLSLRTWEPGATTALVLFCDSGPCYRGQLASLNLLTGRLNTDRYSDMNMPELLLALAGDLSLWTTADGKLWAVRDGEPKELGMWWTSTWADERGLSPSAKHLALAGSWSSNENARGGDIAVLDIESLSLAVLPVAEGPRQCTARSWLDDTRLLVLCSTPGEGQDAAVVVDIATGMSSPWTQPVEGPWYPAQGPALTHEFRLGPHTWLGTFATDEEKNQDYGPTFGIERDGVVFEIPIEGHAGGFAPNVRVVGHVGNDVVLWTDTAASDVHGLWRIVVWDARSGLTNEVFPAPPAGPARSAADQAAYGVTPIGLASWAVGY